MEFASEPIEQSLNTQYSNWVYEALDELPDNFTITDPCLFGHPIVFASQGFLKMCGYSKEEVIGRNGRIFQGLATNRRSVMEVREAIREERPVQLSLLNYRKDGTPFWILFHMSPVFREEDGRVVHFIGVQVPLSRKAKSSRSCAPRHGDLSCIDGHRSHEIRVGACRRELCCSDSSLEVACGASFESASDPRKGGEIEDLCEASDAEKQKALNAINNILSVLSHYSELTGKTITWRKCYVQGPKVLSSALLISLGRIKQSFVLVDPYLPNFPIVYASDNFLNVTGYARHEVLGRSHQFLCGLETDPSTVLQINDSIQKGTACKVRILNYRNDNTSFWNLIHVSPVRNASGKIAYFVEAQMEEEEHSERPIYSSGSSDSTGSPELRLLGVIGAVKVAIRAQYIGAAGPSQSMPRRDSWQNSVQLARRAANRTSRDGSGLNLNPKAKACGFLSLLHYSLWIRSLSSDNTPQPKKQKRGTWPEISCSMAPL